jgi:hydrogenase maturation protein HypF
VQHHHAHLAACLAEHGETGRAVGAIFDGSGYGTDGTVWGGELLVGDLAGFERVGHLAPVRLPGGDAAVREPWRMALAWGAPVRGIDARHERAVERMIATELNSPLTSSVGRLFDAVAALAGLRNVVTYEGQAAIELEAAYDPSVRGMYEIDVDGGVIDPRAAVAAAAAEPDAHVVATRFHRGLADATVRACAALAGEHGTEVVVLSGGVFQNRRLLEGTAGHLRGAGLRVLTPWRLPANDGGISYGQAAVAAAR